MPTLPAKIGEIAIEVVTTGMGGLIEAARVMKAAGQAAARGAQDPDVHRTVADARKAGKAEARIVVGAVRRKNNALQSRCQS